MKDGIIVDTVQVKAVEQVKNSSSRSIKSFPDAVVRQELRRDSTLTTAQRDTDIVVLKLDPGNPTPFQAELNDALDKSLAETSAPEKMNAMTQPGHGVFGDSGGRLQHQSTVSNEVLPDTEKGLSDAVARLELIPQASRSGLTLRMNWHPESDTHRVLQVSKKDLPALVQNQDADLNDVLNDGDFINVVEGAGRFQVYITVQANAFRQHKVISFDGASAHSGHSDAVYPYAPASMEPSAPRARTHRMIVITIDQPVSGPRRSFQRFYTTRDGSFVDAAQLETDLKALAGDDAVTSV
eukprot:COSAG06_NODE_13656_length_1234_cov_1.724229_1_plen_296_part_00